MTAKRLGSSPNWPARERSQRMALTSCTWAGNSAWEQDRTLTPATAKPLPLKKPAIELAPLLPSSLIQAEPPLQVTSGQRPGLEGTLAS